MLQHVEDTLSQRIRNTLGFTHSESSRAAGYIGYTQAQFTFQVPLAIEIPQPSE